MQEVSNISSLGLMSRALRLMTSGRQFTYGIRSILLMIKTEAFLNMAGYFLGLSSPSVVDRMTTFSSSPKS